MPKLARKKLIKKLVEKVTKQKPVEEQGLPLSGKDDLAQSAPKIG